MTSGCVCATERKNRQAFPAPPLTFSYKTEKSLWDRCADGAPGWQVCTLANVYRLCVCACVCAFLSVSVSVTMSLCLPRSLCLCVLSLSLCYIHAFFAGAGNGARAAPHGWRRHWAKFPTRRGVSEGRSRGSAVSERSANGLLNPRSRAHTAKHQVHYH